jgi:hypothetical protein
MMMMIFMASILMIIMIELVFIINNYFILVPMLLHIIAKALKYVAFTFIQICHISYYI